MMYSVIPFKVSPVRGCRPGAVKYSSSSLLVLEYQIRGLPVCSEKNSVPISTLTFLKFFNRILSKGTTAVPCREYGLLSQGTLIYRVSAQVIQPSSGCSLNQTVLIAANINAAIRTTKMGPTNLFFFAAFSFWGVSVPTFSGAFGRVR